MERGFGMNWLTDALPGLRPPGLGERCASWRGVRQWGIATAALAD